MASLGSPVFLRNLGDPRAPKAVVVRWRHEDAVIDVPASDVVRLTLSLVDGQRVRDQSSVVLAADRVRAGSMSLFPGREHTRVVVEGRADVFQIFLRDDWLRSVVGDRFVSPTLFDSHDADVQASVMRVLVASANDRRGEALLLEESLRKLARQLRRHAAKPLRGRVDPGPFRGGLSPSVQRRVDGVISAAVGEPGRGGPTLPEMAAVANLSVSHFLRAFQRQTGETPHRHLLRRRLERAVPLLGHQRASVAEVADEAGFSTPAHFVATFRRLMGVTPGALRNALTR